MARPHRSFGGKRSARLTQWIGPAAQDYVNVAAGGATLLGSAPFEEAATIMRTRGQVSIIPQAVSADVAIAGAFGIGIVSQEAFAAGVASKPTAVLKMKALKSQPCSNQSLLSSLTGPGIEAAPAAIASLLTTIAPTAIACVSEAAC